jgi:hypothetical protein
MKHLYSVLILLLTACGSPGNPSIDPLIPLSPAAEGQSTATLVPRWAEYESALAHKFLPEEIKGVCEWGILGQAEQDVFVWAVCQGHSPISGPSGMSAPAVVHLAADGQVQSVTIPRDGTLYSQDVEALFPRELHRQIFTHTLAPEIEEHLRIRIANPDTPPLRILSGTPLP